MYGHWVAHETMPLAAGDSLRVVRVAGGRVVITAASDGSAVRAGAGDYVVLRDHETFQIAPQQAVTELRTMAISTPPGRDDCGPRMLRLAADPGTAAALDATFGLLEHERDRGGPGADLVTSRLGDVLATHTLRAIATTTSAGPAAVLELFDDPRVGRAARAMRDDLARPWTVASLAREARMSRAGFAVAFRQAAGDSPLGLLRRWRLCQVKRLLRETGLTLTEIALRVGYESAPALSRAFRRQERMSPGRWRDSR